MARRESNRRGEGDHLRVQLIEAATELLVSPQQVAAPSLRSIARRVGVSPSGVYLHFASSEDLLAAAIEAQYDELRSALAQRRVATGTPAEQLIAMARAYVRWGVEHPGAYQLLFESADALPSATQVTGRGDDLIAGVAALVKAHRECRPAVARQRAMRIWTALHGIVSLRIHKPHASWGSSALAEAGDTVRLLLD